MTDQTAQEPTMEEILASIRRIISEDDAPAETAAGAPAVEPVHEPEAVEAMFEAQPEVEEPSPALMDETLSLQEEPAAEDDVLELTDRYEETAPAPALASPEVSHSPASHSLGDLDIGDADPFPMDPEPTPFRSEPVSTQTDYDSLVGESASASAASAFAGLAASLRTPEPETGGTGPTVDDLARSLLRPMLKEWLDANLAGIVEAQVRKEVERIARDGR